MPFHSNRLIYKKLKHEDLENYLLVVCDGDVMKYTSGYAFTRINGISRFNRTLEQNKEYRKVGYYSVKNKMGEFIAYAKLQFVNPTTLESGYCILKKYWRQGYGTEISQALVSFAQTLEPYNKLIAITHPENINSQKILMKSGFEFEKEIEYEGQAAKRFVQDLVRNP